MPKVNKKIVTKSVKYKMKPKGKPTKPKKDQKPKKSKTARQKMKDEQLRSKTNYDNEMRSIKLDRARRKKTRQERKSEDKQRQQERALKEMDMSFRKHLVSETGHTVRSLAGMNLAKSSPSTLSDFDKLINSNMYQDGKKKYESEDVTNDGAPR